MGPKQRKTSADDTEEQAALALRLIEVLNDDNVLKKLKNVLFPEALSEKIDALTITINRLTKQVNEKDETINVLQTRIDALEDSNDDLEQRMRRPNLKIYGVPEQREGECTDGLVLAVVNGKMGMTPPIEVHQLERSHRLGCRDANGQARAPAARPIIVRFRSERLRDNVPGQRTGQRTQLK